jgi:hypothetical protein
VNRSGDCIDVRRAEQRSLARSEKFEDENFARSAARFRPGLPPRIGTRYAPCEKGGGGQEVYTSSTALISI